MARRYGPSTQRHEFPIGHKPGGVLDERGWRDARKFYRLEERFEKLPQLNAVLVLATSPSAAALAAALAANTSFEHLGTNTEVFTFANQFDFGAGIKMCTATADADSAILLPSTISGQTGWAVSDQWSSERSPGFECVITPTPASQITTVALTTNIATITTGAAHGLAPGETVVITLDQADSDYAATSSLEGTWVVATVATTTTFTFAYTHANVTSASIAGSCRQATNQISGSAGIAIASIAVSSNVVTLTLAGKHGWGVDIINVSFDRNSAAYVALSAADKAIVLACEGTKTLTSAYSAAATTVTYAQTIGDLTTANCTGTATEIALNASLTKTMFACGFKLTGSPPDPVVGTDDDQCFLRFCSCVSATATGAVSQYWQFITSRGGTDIVTNLTNVAPPEMGTTYRIEIYLDSSRIPSLYINGQKIDIGTGAAALRWGIDFIPYVFVAASGIVPAAKAICLEYISCTRKSDRSAA